MQIATYNTYPENLTIAEVDIGEGKPWAFLPFEDQLAELTSIDDTLVLAIGSDRGYAVFDCRRQRRLAQARVAERHSKAWAFCKARQALFVADGDGTIVGDNSWRQLNGILEIPLGGGPNRFHLIAPDFLVRWIGVRDDGRIVCEGAAQIAILDPATGETTLSRAEGYQVSVEHGSLTWLKWISPNARWGLRIHLGSVIRQEPIKTRFWKRLLAETPQLPHPDLQADGRWRYGLALDLFELDPVRFKRRLIVRYRASEEMFSDQWGRAREHRAQIDALADQQDHRTWNGRDQLLMTKVIWGFREEDKAGKSLDALVADLLLKPMRHVRWDDDSQGFTVVIGDQERHVTLDGAVGPLSPSTWTDQTERPSLPSAAAIKSLQREIRERSVQRLALPDLSAAGLGGAIRAMADRLESGLEAITFRDVLQFRFKVGGKTIGETALFKAVRALPDQDAEMLLSDLRRLIASFSEQARAHVLTGGDSISSGGDPETMRVALADAALALAELDPASFEVLRGWFEQVDQEHDVFAAEKVFPAMARKTAFQSPGAVRFGFWFFLHQWQTRPCSFADLAILSRAREIWTPTEFANVMLEEAKRVVEDRGPGYIRQDFNSCYCAIETLLDPEVEWDRLALAEADRIFPNENEPADGTGLIPLPTLSGRS